MALAAEPIKIGFSMSLTGGLASGGKGVLTAFEIWKDDVNAKGGLLGRPVEFVYYDDQSSPANVPPIYTKLLDIDKVDLVVSSSFTNQIAPAMPIVMARNLVFFAIFGTAVNDRFNYPRYFQILPNGTDAKSAPSAGFLETAMTMDPKPRTIALAGADAEFSQTALEGARAIAKRLGLTVVYDRTYPPGTADFVPVIRAIQAANPDIVFVASYPVDSVGMVRAANELRLKTRMFGGAMIGLQFPAVKAQLGPLLDGVVVYDTFIPEPTMKFPGVDEFLARYQERAGNAGIDPLYFSLPPFAYAELQILGQAVTATGGLDQDKIAQYVHKTGFSTIVGDVAFAENGEWAKPRILFGQFRDVTPGDATQFREPGKEVIIYPPEFKSGEFVYPYADVPR